MLIVGSGVDWCCEQLIYSISTQALIDFRVDIDNRICVEVVRRLRQLWGNGSGNDDRHQVIHSFINVHSCKLDSNESKEFLGTSRNHFPQTTCDFNTTRSFPDDRLQSLKHSKGIRWFSR